MRIRWVASDSCETEAGAQKALGGVDAVLVPGGFGVRGIEGKVGALRWARERLVPTLGICLGLQCMVIEYARAVAGIDGASSTEFDPGTPAPVIATMEEQKAFVEGAGDLGGTMRLGSQRAALVAGSVVAGAYGATHVDERHRHRYEVNESYREALEEAGLVISGTLARARPRGVRRAARRRAPLLRLHAGPPGVQVAPHAGAPPVRRAHRRRHRAQRAARLVEVERPRHHEPTPRRMPEPLRDRLEPRPVLSSELAFAGRVWDVRSEHVDLGDGGVVVRDYVDHTGAVAVLALDDEDRVVLVQQYRHPVGAFEWELPAGLLDVERRAAP